MKTLIRPTDGRTIHCLKTDPAIFHAVRLGKLAFQVRKDDRAFQSGDLVQFEYFDRIAAATPFAAPAPASIPEPFTKQITFIMRGSQYGLASDVVSFGIADETPPNATADEMRSTLIEIIGIARDRMDDEFTSRTGVLAEIADIAVKVAKPVARPTRAEKEARNAAYGSTHHVGTVERNGGRLVPRDAPEGPFNARVASVRNLFDRLEEIKTIAEAPGVDHTGALQRIARIASIARDTEIKDHE